MCSWLSDSWRKSTTRKTTIQDFSIKKPTIKNSLPEEDTKLLQDADERAKKRMAKERAFEAQSNTTVSLKNIVNSTTLDKIIDCSIPTTEGGSKEDDE